MNVKIHHIGIKVSDINKNSVIYGMLGYKPISEIVFDPIQHNKILFMRSSDGSQVIELIEPMDSDSSIYNFKDGYHHICYEVEDCNTFAEEFKAMKIGKIFTRPIQAPVINNRFVQFACLTNGMFVEFLMH